MIMRRCKFITASQAAEMCGVTTMTIRNLCKAGVLSYRMQSHMFCPKEADVKKYAKSIFEVHKAHVNIKDYSERIWKEERELSDKLHEMQTKYRERMLRLEMFPKRIEAIKETLCAVLNAVSKYMPYEGSIVTERDIRMCWSALQGKSFEEIGKEHGLTEKSARQAWYKALRKFVYTRSIFRHLEEQNDKLREKINKQLDEIEHLKAQLEGREYIETDEERRMNDLLNTSIDDLDLSKRSLNCLQCAGIWTMRDLCQYHRADLLKFRNFGKRSLTELDELLDNNGLYFGMDLSKYGTKSN